MRKIGLLTLLILVGLSLSGQETNKMIYSEMADQEILIGPTTRTGLISDPFKEWFDKEYDSYVLNMNVLGSLPEEAWKEVKITVVLATWCPDSRREIPRFFKVLDEYGFPEDNLTMISVNKNKEVPSMNLGELNFERVPTIIFYRKGKEIGRITESPVQSLEEDISGFLLQDAE